MRFDRNYQLTIGTGNRAVIIRPPLRIVFSADKATTGGLNKMNLEVYNLKESNRLAVVKDPEENKRIPVVLQVGYNGTLQTIFQGSVNRGTNERQGADFISTFECLDGGDDYLYSFTSRAVRGKDTALSEILKDTPNTTRGKITQQRAITRPKILVGNSFQLIEESLDPDEEWYIDNEQLYIVRKDEVVSRFVPVVAASTGLINTPERKEKDVTFQTILNPSIKLGGQVQLKATTAPHLDGIYKVTSMTYAGDYDGSVWTQTVTGNVVPSAKVL